MVLSALEYSVLPSALVPCHFESLGLTFLGFLMGLNHLPDFFESAGGFFTTKCQFFFFFIFVDGGCKYPKGYLHDGPVVLKFSSRFRIEKAVTGVQ